MASNTEDIVKVEGTKGTHRAEDAAQANAGPPALEVNMAKRVALRRYVASLVAATPPAPPHVEGDALKDWQYHHHLTETLKHLLHVYEDHDHPYEIAFLRYEANLVVNNTDHRDSPFMSFKSAETLFTHERIGRRNCMIADAGLSKQESKKLRVAKLGAQSVRAKAKARARQSELDVGI